MTRQMLVIPAPSYSLTHVTWIPRLTIWCDEGTTHRREAAHSRECFGSSQIRAEHPYTTAWQRSVEARCDRTYDRPCCAPGTLPREAGPPPVCPMEVWMNPPTILA